MDNISVIIRNKNEKDYIGFAIQSVVDNFINPEIIAETGKECAFNEGCLSIPGIREDVKRKDSIFIKFQDLNGNFFKESFSGIASRVIQHEYDHIEGILFTDKLSYLKKKTIKRKLTEISTGKVKVDYTMKFL